MSAPSPSPVARALEAVKDTARTLADSGDIIRSGALFAALPALTEALERGDAIQRTDSEEAAESRVRHQQEQRLLERARASETIEGLSSQLASVTAERKELHALKCRVGTALGEELQTMPFEDAVFALRSRAEAAERDAEEWRKLASNLRAALSGEPPASEVDRLEAMTEAEMRAEVGDEEFEKLAAQGQRAIDAAFIRCGMTPPGEPSEPECKHPRVVSTLTGGTCLDCNAEIDPEAGAPRPEYLNEEDRRAQAIDEFWEHVKRVRAMVNKWPEWKRLAHAQLCAPGGSGGSEA